MKHETDIQIAHDGWRATCSCGWEDENSFTTPVRASEAAQEHRNEEENREPTDVEIYGAGSS